MQGTETHMFLKVMSIWLDEGVVRLVKDVIARQVGILYNNLWKIKCSGRGVT